jgi:phosphoribosylformylglycinamidine synthase
MKRFGAGFAKAKWGDGMPLAKVYVTLKKGVLDPQGLTVQRALEALGYSEVKEVRIGKYLEVTLVDKSDEELREHLVEMCEKLLANTVIEDYKFEIES